MLTSGVDLWLNTPRRPFEASGTSGMKAALNGVPSLSVLDGWWVEGWIEGVTGWAIPDSDTQEHEVASLYDRLESTILPGSAHARRAECLQGPENAKSEGPSHQPTSTSHFHNLKRQPRRLERRGICTLLFQ